MDSISGVETTVENISNKVQRVSRTLEFNTDGTDPKIIVKDSDNNPVRYIPPVSIGEQLKLETEQPKGIRIDKYI